MSSDGRYMYHQQGINSNYDYSAYPPPPPPPTYDNSQMNQAPLRPMRSTSSSQPHSPPQQPQYNPPPSSYPPNYGPGPYMTQPPQSQWSSDNWGAHYNQSYPPPPPPPLTETPATSGPGRPDAIPSSLTEPRGYINPPNNPEPRRIEERPQPPNPLPRRREKDSPPVIVSPGTPTGLDFMKLLESYRLIIDAAGALSNGTVSSGRPPSAETVERMFQSATYGVQMLESASQQQPTPASDTRSPKEKEPEEAKELPNDTSSSKRQKTEDAAVQEGQTCLGCNATSTPEWRRGPMGPRTLCNACGLVYAKLIKKRVREGGRAGGKSNGQAANSQGHGDDLASTGEGESDDDDEYGSQDRRSEGGEGGRD